MSPRSERALEAAREESRRRIVSTALALFARQGYAGTSVRAIAKEAGISPGLLYHYFDGKRGVLRAIFARTMTGVSESLERGERTGSPEDRLRGLIRSAFEIVDRELAFWRLCYQLRMQEGVLSALAPEFAGWTEEIRSRLEAILEDAGDARPGIGARALYAAIDGAAQHYAVDPEDYPVAEVADAIIARFLPSPRDIHP